MLLSDLTHFVKFIFSEEDEGNLDSLCFSFSDPDLLQYVTNTESKNKINALRIGDKLTILGEEISYNIEITNIAIRHIFEDTDDHGYGLDLKDCQGQAGEDKPWIFSILVSFKLA